MFIFVINLPSAIERRNFQHAQLSRLGLNFKFLDATSTNDINTTVYKKHAKDWQRPLKKTEVACYFSHRRAWDKVIESNQPALILEDDALLSRCVPGLLKELSNKQGVDLINFENARRKKFVAKNGEDIGCNSELLRLHQDRTGAAGYILWPSGAKKLIRCEQKKGIALADAHITSCNNLRAYQVEPTPIIQLEQCEYYGIQNSAHQTASISSIDITRNSKGNWFFRLKRIFSQIKLGVRQLMLLRKTNRRYIKINNSDFLN
jgi:glycosyl transferase family 25